MSVTVWHPELSENTQDNFANATWTKIAIAAGLTQEQRDEWAGDITTEQLKKAARILESELGNLFYGEDASNSGGFTSALVINQGYDVDRLTRIATRITLLAEAAESQGKTTLYWG